MSEHMTEHQMIEEYTPAGLQYITLKRDERIMKALFAYAEKMEKIATELACNSRNTSARVGYFAEQSKAKKEMKLTQEQIDALNRRLPKAALKAKPGAAGFTSINAMFVVDRLNEVFGVGGWQMSCEEVDKLEEKATNKNGEYTKRMPVVKVIFEVPEFNIHLESYGGNDNADFGDAYKGAQTDALTKIGSYLGIGAGIWRCEYDHKTPDQAPAPQPQPQQTAELSARDKITIAMNFLAGNEKALAHYCRQFNAQTLDAISDGQMLAIYMELKQHNRI